MTFQIQNTDLEEPKFVKLKIEKFFENQETATWETSLSEINKIEELIQLFDETKYKIELEDEIFGSNYYENNKTLERILKYEIINQLGFKQKSMTSINEVSVLFDDIMKGNDTKLKNILKNIHSGIHLHLVGTKQLKDLDMLRATVLLLKNHYENNTLEFEIYDELDEKVSEVLNDIKENKFDNNLEFKFKDLIDIFTEIIEGNKILHEKGNDHMFTSTGSSKGEYKEYQLTKK